MVHASLRMKFNPDKLIEAFEILCTMVERTRVSPGCLGCDLYLDLLESGVLLFEQWWSTHDDLDRHLRSNPYRRVILVMEMAVENPLIRFSEITRTAGLERVRNSLFAIRQAQED